MRISEWIAHKRKTFWHARMEKTSCGTQNRNVQTPYQNRRHETPVKQTPFGKTVVVWHGMTLLPWHSCKSHLRWRSCKNTLGMALLVWHSCGTLLWDTLMDTLVGHSCGSSRLACGCKENSALYSQWACSGFWTRPGWIPQLIRFSAWEKELSF